MNTRPVPRPHARLAMVLVLSSLPIGAYPTGEPHTYRIINPRTFIFTATFDL